jgi:predicted phosphodiesterase
VAGAVDVAILLFGDFHLGSGYSAETRLPPLAFSRSLRLFRLDSKLERFFARKCVAHDAAILRSLPRYVQKLWYELSMKGFSREKLDAALVAGDIVTWPSEDAFAFAASYLSAESVRSTDELTTHDAPGLRLGDSLLAIPGNHDKLLCHNLDAYHTHFSSQLSLPEHPKAKGSYFVSKQFGGREVLFAMLDLSVYVGKGNARALDLRSQRHLARGQVTNAMGSDLASAFQRLREGRRVDDAHLKSFDQALKLLVVHYAVDRLAVTGGLPSVPEWFVPHDCEGLAELVEQNTDSIDAVIHGHLHVPRVYNISGVPIVSLDSVSQQGEKNGFFVLIVSKSGGLSVSHHVWNGATFHLDPDPEYTRPLR